METYYQRNREKRLGYQIEYYKKHRNKLIKYQRKYGQEHKKEIAERHKNYCQKHKDEIAEYQRKYQRKYKQEHKKEIAEYRKEYYQKHKNETAKYQRKLKIEKPYKKFGNFLVKRLKELDRNQSWLARELGVSRESASNYSAGVYSPKKRLRKLCKVLKIKMSVLEKLVCENQDEES